MSLVSTHRLNDDEDGEAFDVVVMEHDAPRRVVLFAAGRGGDPERHRPLLDALHADGATVVAPRSAMFTNPRPTAAQLHERGRRLRRAIDAFAPKGLPLHGVGHSIGATMLFAMAGAQLWLARDSPLDVPPATFESITLLAPALGFFQVPHAASNVRADTTIWWGSADAFCARGEVDHTLTQLGPRGRIHVAEGAGHFSFMHTPPSGTTEPLPDRDAFLAALTAAIADDVRKSRSTTPSG